MSTISREVLDKLRTFDTPTICNIIELFEVRPRNTGYMDARIKACFPEMPPMVGFAATATFRSAAPPRGQGGYASVTQQIERFSELSGPPVIVFQDLDEPSAAATFGEVMCTTYKTFGAQGLISSGTGRDLDQVRAIGFPVFTNGAICSHGYVHIPSIHVPVHVGGITIYPDDLLHGDCNGVTTIPHEIAAEVADIGDEFVAAEQLVLSALRSENPTLRAYDEARAEMGKIVADLRQRVTRAKK
jgi:4-hydroxy-4-methyl-2-oxoglutarate aldolase